MPEFAPKATIKILYNSRNISRDVSASLIAFSYTDKVQGESDELQLTLDDKDGLWLNEWYPEKGATLTAEISYKGQILPCGSFTIDEIELSGPPDVLSIRALAAFVTKKIRTKHSTAHENKTLSEIARTIASKHGLRVAGMIPNVRIQRATQHRQTDLSFLNRLAAEYGAVFSIRDKVMTFTSIYDLEARPGVVSVSKFNLSSYNIKDKTAETYKSARLLYHNPVNDELVTHSETSEAEGVKEDTLELRCTAENTQQAELKTKAALHNANTIQQEGAASMEGNALMVSGNNFELTNAGAVSGICHIIESTHSIDRSGGYRTEITFKRVGTVPPAKRKP